MSELTYLVPCVAHRQTPRLAPWWDQDAAYVELKLTLSRNLQQTRQKRNLREPSPACLPEPNIPRSTSLGARKWRLTFEQPGSAATNDVQLNFRSDAKAMTNPMILDDGVTIRKSNPDWRNICTLTRGLKKAGPEVKQLCPLPGGLGTYDLSTARIDQGKPPLRAWAPVCRLSAEGRGTSST
jgi:hypothetical protein